jgi:hypothetical protein
MDPWVQAAIVAFTAIGASSGFWAYILQRNIAKSASSRLLMGLAYDKIMHLGMQYIERGWISRDEFEDFRNYLFDPYKAMGGNGVAERIMQEVSSLRIQSYPRFVEINNKKDSEKNHERL